MEPKTLKAALGLALEHGRPRTKVLFSGGEPLLEFGLVREAVAYVERNLRASRQVLFTLITNGTLLTEEVIRYLARYSIAVQVSFDGVRPAQDWRAKGTFVSLDSLLDLLQSAHPDFFSSNVKISTTVIPQTVQYIADSFEYFLAKGIHRVAIAPSIADTSAWKPEQIEQFEEQWTRVFEMSVAHLERTGEIPLLFLRQGGGDSSRPANDAPSSAGHGQHSAVPRGGEVKRGGREVCAAGRGEMLAVDADGMAYPCITLAASCQTFTSQGLRECSEALRLGSITGQELWERHGRVPEAARALDIFAPKETRYSAYGACRDCTYLAQCTVCPLAIAHLPGGRLSERVPDFTCAFNFTALKCRERFWQRLNA